MEDIPASEEALLFDPGQLFLSLPALSAIEANGKRPLEYVKQHMTGDWGMMDPEDTAYNWWAVRNASQILSSYRLPDGTEIWVITNGDRTMTTLLLPEEY